MGVASTQHILRFTDLSGQKPDLASIKHYDDLGIGMTAHGGGLRTLHQVCMYVCAVVCMYVICMCICVRCMYVRAVVCMYVYMYVYMCTMYI